MRRCSVGHGILARAGQHLIWTVGTLALQIVFGVAMALLLNQNILFRSLARSLILFPYFVSTVVAVLVWRWLFNDLYGILNHMMMWPGCSRHAARLARHACRTPWSASSWSAPGSTFPSWSSPCWRGCRPSPSSSTRPRPSTAPGAWARFWDVTLPQLRDVLIVVDPAARDLGLQGIRPDLPADRRRPGHRDPDLPLMVYKQAFGAQRDGQAPRPIAVR